MQAREHRGDLFHLPRARAAASEIRSSLSSCFISSKNCSKASAVSAMLSIALLATLQMEPQIILLTEEPKYWQISETQTIRYTEQAAK